MNTPTRTPLAWPAGLPRGRMRERSRFKTRTFAAAERELLAELERMNAKQCVVSSSVPSTAARKARPETQAWPSTSTAATRRT